MAKLKSKNLEKLKVLGNRQRKIIGVLLLAMLMVFALLAVRAGAPFISFEAEGAAGINTITKSASAASGGKYLEFTGSGPVEPPTTFPSAMWHADADIDVDHGDNTNFWKKEVTSDTMSRLSIVNDPKGIYDKVYRAYLTPNEINSGDKRAEFAQALLGDGDTKLKLANDSSPRGSTQDIWFGWRSLFGKDVVVNSGHSNDGNYMQLKGDSSCGGPTVGLTIKFGRLTLRSEQFLTEHNNIAWNGPQISTLLDDSWHSFVLHVRFSKDAAVGFIEVWLDGQQQTLSNNQTRIHFPTVCPNDTYVYPKMGVYGMDSAIGGGPQHWFESPRIGTSFDAVVPR